MQRRSTPRARTSRCPRARRCCSPASTGARRSIRARRCRCSASTAARAPALLRPTRLQPGRRCCRARAAVATSRSPRSTFDTYTEDLGCPANGAEERTRYQAFADVTSLVQVGGGGTYTVAQRAGRHGRRPPRRLVARRRLPGHLAARAQPDRLRRLRAGRQRRVRDAPRERLQDAAAAPANTQLGIVSYEGDLNLTGDSLALNGTTLERRGAPGRQLLRLGHLRISARPSRPSRRTTATSSASTPACSRCRRRGRAGRHQREHRAHDERRPLPPGVVYFRTDIYAPEMVLKKTVTDVNGGDVNPGDVLRVLDQLDQHGRRLGLRQPHQRRDPGAHDVQARLALDRLEPRRASRAPRPTRPIPTRPSSTRGQ